MSSDHAPNPAPQKGASLIRALAASIVRRLPPTMPKHEGIVTRLNDRFKKVGHPVVRAPMKLGYEMFVDLRSYTEFRTYYTGEYDTQLIRTALKLQPKQAVLLDVGANIGFWTVPFAQRVKRNGGAVFSFEPVPSNARRLERNLELNDVRDAVVLIETGLSSAHGRGKLTLREDFMLGAATGNAAIRIPGEFDEKFETIEIELQTLDRVAADRGIRKIDFIKLDIEGHEDHFLAGARGTLRTMRPIVLTELNKDYFARRRVDAGELFASVFDGLDYIYLKRHLTSGKWERVPAFDSEHEIDDLFLVPREKESDVLAALARD